MKYTNEPIVLCSSCLFTPLSNRLNHLDILRSNRISVRNHNIEDTNFLLDSEYKKRMKRNCSSKILKSNECHSNCEDINHQNTEVQYFSKDLKDSKDLKNSSKVNVYSNHNASFLSLKEYNKNNNKKKYEVEEEEVEEEEKMESILSQKCSKCSKFSYCLNFSKDPKFEGNLEDNKLTDNQKITNFEIDTEGLVNHINNKNKNNNNNNNLESSSKEGTHNNFEGNSNAKININLESKPKSKSKSKLNHNLNLNLNRKEEITDENKSENKLIKKFHNLNQPPNLTQIQNQNGDQEHNNNKNKNKNKTLTNFSSKEEKYRILFDFLNNVKEKQKEFININPKTVRKRSFLDTNKNSQHLNPNFNLNPNLKKIKEETNTEAIIKSELLSSKEHFMNIMFPAIQRPISNSYWQENKINLSNFQNNDNCNNIINNKNKNIMNMRNIIDQTKKCKDKKKRKFYLSSATKYYYNSAQEAYKLVKDEENSKLNDLIISNSKNQNQQIEKIEKIEKNEANQENGENKEKVINDYKEKSKNLFDMPRKGREFFESKIFCLNEKNPNLEIIEIEIEKEKGKRKEEFEKMKKTCPQEVKPIPKISKQNESFIKYDSKKGCNNPPLKNMKFPTKIQKPISNNLFSEINIILDQRSEYSSLIPPTKIKIIHSDYNKHSFHYLNIIFRLINEFGSCFSKGKEFSLPLNKIIYLANFFQLNVSSKDITLQNLKNKEFLNKIKEQLLIILYRSINYSNQLVISSSAQPLWFKSHIENGNNGTVIMHLLKQRGIWAMASKKDKKLINLFWTEWKKKKIINNLNMYNDIKNKEENKDKELIDEINNLLIPPSAFQNKPLNVNKIEILEKIYKLLHKKHVNKEADSSNDIQICNHLSSGSQISQKKFTYINLLKYYQKNNQDPFISIPITFHIKYYQDEEWKKFESCFYNLQESGNKLHNIWIIKPGENSNRGNGITISQDILEIKNRIPKSTKKYTFIIQKYIERPLLINKRKFDIRCYCLVTSINGWIKGYFYNDGYIRTSSLEFNLKNLENKFIHLTNDAVQQKSEEYGKHESGNKVFLKSYHLPIFKNI